MLLALDDIRRHFDPLHCRNQARQPGPEELLAEEKILGHQRPETTVPEERHEAADQFSCEQAQVPHGKVDYTVPKSTPERPAIRPVRSELIIRHAQVDGGAPEPGERGGLYRASQI